MSDPRDEGVGALYTTTRPKGDGRRKIGREDSSPEIISEEIPPVRARPAAGGNQANHERLNTNKAAVLVDVERYLENNPRVPEVTARTTLHREAINALTQVQDSLGDYNSAAVRRNYSAAIQLLNQARDAEQGIKWYISEPHPGDETRTLVRDTRAMTAPPNPNSPESYAMNFLNISRAAEVMLDEAIELGAGEDEIREIRQKTRTRAQELVTRLQEGRPITNDTLIHLSDSLVTDLSSLRNGEGEKVFPKAKKTLNRAKSLTALDDEHFHISTLSIQKDAQGRNRTAVESEVMALGSTEGLREQYNNIRRTAPGEAAGIAWYDELPDAQRRLVRRYATQLGNGNRVLSSQMFDFVPGLKNAYLKVVSVTKPDRPAELQTTLEVLHCGTPTFHGKGNTQAATAATIEQARNLAGPEGEEAVDFALHTLNTDRQGGKEGEIVAQLREFVEAHEGTSLDVAPVNFFRRIARASHTFTDRTLREFSNVVSERGAPETVVNFIRQGEQTPWWKIWRESDHKKALRGIRELQDRDPELARAAAAAVRLRLSRDRASGLSRRNNFRISTEAALVDHEMNMLGGPTHRPKRRWYFCKSGKDRTGSAMYRATHLAVSDHLGLTAVAMEEEKAKEQATTAQNEIISNMHVLAEAGNAQFMAGMQGATVGAHGILPHTPRGALDRSTRASTAVLGANTAKANKVKTRKSLWGIFKRRVSNATAREVEQAVHGLREGFAVRNPLHVPTVTNANRKRVTARTR